MEVKGISDIADKTNYLVDIPLIINANIIEYDISKANITILYSYGFLSKDEYETLYKMDKMTREISIGRRKIDDEEGKLTEEGILMTKIEHEGISKARHLLLETNNVPPESVLRIANDAVYINGPRLANTSFDLNGNGIITAFRSDKLYNIMLNLNLITIFIYDNPMTDALEIDVKGINDKVLYKHQPFLEFICNIITDIQRSSKESVLYTFNDFYSRYINLELPMEYYREFNANSGFMIRGTKYFTDVPNTIDLSLIDINYNLTILRQLYSIIIGF